MVPSKLPIAPVQGGSCNQIPAFLFQEESFVVTDKTKPCQTSQLCKWNIPSDTKVDIKPLPAQEIIFQNQYYARVNERDLQKDKDLYMEIFTSLHSPQKAPLSNVKNLREKFYIAIKDRIKNSRLGNLIEKKPFKCTNAQVFNLP